MANRIPVPHGPLPLSRACERSRLHAQLLIRAYELTAPVGRPTAFAPPGPARGASAAAARRPRRAGAAGA
jgi:hypothetical protein